MPFKNKTIQQGWESFRENTISKDAPAIQISEMKNSFYAGAAYSLALTVEVGAEENEENAVAILNGVSEEIHDFASRLGN